MFAADERKAALDHSLKLWPEHGGELGSLVANSIDQMAGILAINEEHSITPNLLCSDLCASVVLGIDHGHASGSDHDVVEVGIGARYDSIVQHLDAAVTDELVKKATYDSFTVGTTSPRSN